MIRLATEKDIPEIAAILNDPQVKKGALFPPDVEVDPSWFMSIGFILLANGGCFICIPLDDETLDVHTNFLTGMRGKNAIEEAKSALRIVFSETLVTKIMTKVPIGYKHTSLFTKWLGFDKVGESNGMELYSLTIEKFIGMDDELKKLGKRFHENLPHEHKHDDNDYHNGCVGFVALCIKSQRTYKAVQIYNRLAFFMGWNLISIKQEDPLVIDMGTGLIHVNNDNYTLEKV